jgi:hypothetical protein
MAKFKYDDILLNQSIALDLPFIEGTATTSRDISKNHNNGTFKASGEPAWSQLASGIWTVSFDGSDDYVEMSGNPATLQFSNNFTIEYWGKMNSTQVSGRFANPIGKDHSGSAGVTFQIDYLASSYYWHVGHGGGLYSLNCPGANLLDNTWHMIHFTKSSTESMKFYKDGAFFSELVGTTSNVSWVSNSWRYGLGFGGRGAKMLGGRLRMYSVVLTAAQVQTRYNETRTLYGV